MTNTFEVNKAISAKLGIEEQPANTYEAVRAQVDKLGGDLSKVNDIYTGELEVLEHIGGGGGGTEGYDFSSLGYSSNTLANYSVQEAIKQSEAFKLMWDLGTQPTTQQYITFFPNIDTSHINTRGITLFRSAMYIDIADLSGAQLGTSASSNYITALNNNKNLIAINKIIFPTGCTSYQSLFSNDSHLTSIPPLDCTGITNFNFMFNGCSSLTNIVLKNVSGVTTTNQMFSGCSSLTTIPLFDTSSVTSMYGMFLNCSSLTSIPLFDTSNVTAMSSMFNGCSSLTSIPELDTSAATAMSSMFNGCSSLTSIPELDTSAATDMSSMFDGCSSLTSIPELDTSAATDMSSMFDGCSSLTSIPLFDTSNVTDMYNMFNGCSSLTTIPLFDTSNVTNMGNTFLRCTSLTTIPLLYCGGISRFSYIFSGCTSLQNVAGFTDLGQALTRTATFSMADCPLTSESIDNIISTIYDCTENSFSPTLELSVNTAVSDEQKAALTAKNWTLTQV